MEPSSSVPDMAVQFMDIIGLPLPDPQQLVRTALNRRPAERKRRELFFQVIAVHHPETLDGVCKASVLPSGTYLLPAGIRAVLQYILAHINENSISITHISVYLQKMMTVLHINTNLRTGAIYYTTVYT